MVIDNIGLFEVRGMRVGLISGKPKRRFRNLIRPVTREITRRTNRRIKRATNATIDRAKSVLEPKARTIKVSMALELERTQILKRKKGKARRKALEDLGEI